MRKVIATLSALALSAALFAAGEPVGTGEPTQTWEQKQEALKTCADEQLQVKEELKVLEQAKLQAATDAEKAQIQAQIETKTAELTQLQTRYANMIASHTAYKYEFKDMNGDGVNDNVAGSGDPVAKAYMYKNGYGYGYGFVDADKDGVNDNFVDADKDGKCDMDPAMAKTRTQSRDKVKGKSQHGDHQGEQSRDQLRGTK